MTEPPEPPGRANKGAGFLFLMLGLWVLLLAPALLKPLIPVLEPVVTTGLFVALVLLSMRGELLLRAKIALWLVLAAVVARHLILDYVGHSFESLVRVLSLIALVFTTYDVISQVLRPGPVTKNKLYASISGYMLVGVVFATIYSLMEQLQPGSFSIPREEADVPQALMYFSMVTLSTLGYGDVAPLREMSRMLAVSEALIGQMYLAVVVARLVGLHIAHGARADTSIES